VIDPNTNPATYYASAAENTNGDSQQNSPKRQRTGNDDNLNVAGGSNENTITREAENRGGHTQGSHQNALQGGAEKGKEIVVSSSSYLIQFLSPLLQESRML
jgi:hypothetical protein